MHDCKSWALTVKLDICLILLLPAGLHAEADATWRMVHQASTTALRQLNCSARLGTAEEFCAAMAEVRDPDTAGAYRADSDYIDHAAVKLVKVPSAT